MISLLRLFIDLAPLDSFKANIGWLIGRAAWGLIAIAYIYDDKAAALMAFIGLLIASYFLYVGGMWDELWDG